MVSPTNPNDDFYARALASFNQQMAIGNNNDAATKEVEQYAKSLVDDDHPKIDAAVKSYLSLVAARSAVASDIDVLPDSTSTTDIVQCTFATSNKSPMDANRCSLMCARTLLSTINSTTIPTDFEKGVDTSTINEDEDFVNEEDKMKSYMQDNTSKILWNRLVVQSNSNAGDKEKAKQTKPSRVLGKKSLLVAYPYIQERIHRGIILLSEDGGKDDTTIPSASVDDDTTNANNPLQSLSNEVLPPVNPPKGIELDQWEAFYTEFGQLLSRAFINDNDDKDTDGQTKAEQHDDSALIWSSDKGKSELQSRRESRAKRASNALSSVEDAKVTITEALGGGDGEEK